MRLTCATTSARISGTLSSMANGPHPRLHGHSQTAAGSLDRPRRSHGPRRESPTRDRRTRFGASRDRHDDAGDRDGAAGRDQPPIHVATADPPKNHDHHRGQVDRDQREDQRLHVWIVSAQRRKAMEPSSRSVTRYSVESPNGLSSIASQSYWFVVA